MRAKGAADAGAAERCWSGRRTRALGLAHAALRLPAEEAAVQHQGLPVDERRQGEGGEELLARRVHQLRQGKRI